MPLPRSATPALLLAASAAAALTLATPRPSAAQVAAIIRADRMALGRSVLKAYDVNADDALDGRELDACRCRDWDRDRDATVSLEEFATGYADAPAGRRDALTKALDAQPAARPEPNVAPAAPPNAPWRAGQRVEVQIDGAWVAASVLRMGEGAEAGQVHVSLDGYTYGTSRMERVDAARVRPLAVAPAPARVPRGLPATLPAGLYTCGTSLTTQTASTWMTLGRLRLRSDGTYTGLSPDGNGAGGRYRYDPGTGKVEWVGGLQGFKGFPNGTTVRPGPQPIISVNYAVREGGWGGYTMECSRE